MNALVLDAAQIDSFRCRIYDFYSGHGRDFAWRHTRDPYAVLVSEMMLQQTQTSRVVPKYDAWMARFPDVWSLAQAPLADVLAAWNGLGYNRRAVFLQKACAAVCAEHGGMFPRTRKQLESLPGIGPYTAGAVAAFAFGLPEVFIETNIRSVFIHCFYEDAFISPDSKIPDTVLIPLVEQTLDVHNPREWYYALMDYGADLKKRMVNPSRRSRSYAVQSRFEGSLRQARGAIIRQLSQQGSATLYQISVAEHVDMARLEKAAEKLVSEQLIEQCAGGYCICGQIG